MGSLFYGLILKDEEVMAMKEQVAHRRRVEKDERPIGWRMVERLDKMFGKDSGRSWQTIPWYIRQRPEIEQIVTMINDYLPDAVSLEMIRGLPEQPEYHPDPLFTLQVSGMSWGPSDKRLQFNPNTEEADKVLREMCDTYGLSGQTPGFHILGNVDFFYGVPVLSRPSEGDLPFLKQVLRWDYLDLCSQGGLPFHQSYDPCWVRDLIAEQIAPEKYQNWKESEEIKELLKRKDWGPKEYSEYDARYDSLVNSVFGSEGFVEWGGSKDLYHMFDLHFMRCLDYLWEKQGDSVGILQVCGDPLRLHVPPPHLRRKSYRPATIFFYVRKKISELGKEVEWDASLREKCEKYGVPFNNPGVYFVETR